MREFRIRRTKTARGERKRGARRAAGRAKGGVSEAERGVNELPNSGWARKYAALAKTRF